MQSTQNETWKPVLEYEGHYEVGDLGQVRSVKGGVIRMLKQMTTTNGKYLLVDLNRPSAKRNMARVHRLVAEAFHGKPADPELTDCAHIDGDGHNNRADNLRWLSHRDNLMERQVHGTEPNRNKTHCPNGHPLIPGNLVAYPLRTKGHRICRTCRLAQDARARHAAKEKLHRVR